MKKPKCCKKEHLTYLYKLRESGTVNMFGAVPNLISEYTELTKEKAEKILIYWMENFDNDDS